MANVDPNAAELLQDYLRHEFDPTPEESVEDLHSWGWHRVQVRSKKYRSFPFADFQTNTLLPFTPALTTSPVTMMALPPQGRPRVPPTEQEVQAALRADRPWVLGGSLDMQGYDIIDVGDMAVNTLSAAPLGGTGSSTTSDPPALAAAITLTTNLDLDSNDIANVGDIETGTISGTGVAVEVATELQVNVGIMVPDNQYVYFGLDGDTGFRCFADDDLDLVVETALTIEFRTALTTFLTDVDFDDNDITSVGDIELDSITKDGVGVINVASDLQVSAALSVTGGNISLTAGDFRIAQGQEIILDNDLDSGIYASADDTMGFYTGGVLRATLNNSGYLANAPVDLDGEILYLDADADTRISAVVDDEMSFRTGGAERMSLENDGLHITSTMFVPTSGWIEFDNDGDSYIWCTADDNMQIVAGPTTISVRGDVGRIILNATDKVDVSGTDLHIDQAKKVIFDTDDDTYIYCLIDDFLLFNVGGANYLTMAASTFTLGANIDFNVGANGIFGVPASGEFQLAAGAKLTLDNDADTYLICSADDTFEMWCAASKQMTMTDGQFDFNAGLLTNFAGRRLVNVYGWTAANPNASRLLHGCYPYVSGLAAGYGYVALRSGSIVGISGFVDVNAYVDGEINIEVGYHDGAYNALFTYQTGFVAVADAQKFNQTYARGTYTFSAGDTILVYRKLTGTATTDDLAVFVEMEFDT